MAGTCSAPAARAQTIRISPQTGSPGDWVTLEIAFQPGEGPAPVALQWELEIPAGPLDLEEAPISKALLVAKDAGKSVQCAGSTKAGGRLLQTCILSGTQKPVPAGTIVVLSLKIGQRAQPGGARIRLQKALGVTLDLKQLPIAATDSVLTVRAR